jgi:hypothetical protein
MKYLIQSTQLKYKHGGKFRSYFGYIFNKNKCFMIDRGGFDLMIIDEEKNEVEIVENYRINGFVDDLKQMKCQVLEWLDFWEDHSQEYWIDILYRLKQDTKNSMDAAEFDKRWLPFFQQCAHILLDRSKAWKPTQVIDGMSIYN